MSDDKGQSPAGHHAVLVTPGYSASEDDWCIPILRDFVASLSERTGVSIVTLRYPEPGKTYKVGGVPVTALGGGQRKGVSKFGLLGRAVSTVVREVRRTQADVIHAFWGHEPGAVAVIAGRLTRTPVVVSLMGGELASIPSIAYGGLLSPGNRLLARFCLPRADRVVALCNIVQDAASSWVRPTRLVRLDFGVDTDRFGPPPQMTGNGHPHSVCRFAMVGSLVPVKGHDTVLRALARCQQLEPGLVTLSLLGEGHLRQELEDTTANLGLSSAVHFRGEIDHAAVAQHLQEADALVVASLWEGGWPQAAHEALATGLPIVSTAVGAMPELTEAVRCVDVGDVEGLSREILSIATDPDERARMSGAALEAARSVADCVADFRSLYATLERGKPGVERG